MGKTVLITDDDKLTREGLATMLRGSGHSVIEAEDGEQALEMLNQRRPDLLISDVRMPNMDGVTLVENIRASESLKDLPIIILTNDDTLGQNRCFRPEQRPVDDPHIL
jgi:two-component system chemotaxis response regulator CheY